MNILRGTFRLSLVAAALGAAYAAITDFQKYQVDRTERFQLISTLKCGARIDPAILQKYLNDFGNYDLGKAGCSDKQFWGSAAEMKDAWEGKMDTWESTTKPFRIDNVIFSALSWFILTNLAGLAAMAVLRVYRWVAGGFAKG